MPDEHELELLKHLEQVDPGSPALLELARAYLIQDHAAAAAQVAERVFNAHPNNLEAALIMAQSFENQGHPELARDILDQIIPSLDRMAKVFDDLAQIFDLVEEHDTAHRLAGAHIALTMGISPAQEKDDEEDESFESAEEPLPTETLADLYLDQGLNGQALEMYQRLIITDPDNERIQEKILTIKHNADQFNGIEPEPGPAPTDNAAKLKLIKKLEKFQAAAQKRQQVLAEAV